MGRIKEALTSAKDALQRMPRNPKALTLVGIALSQLPEGLEKGKVLLSCYIMPKGHGIVVLLYRAYV